MHGDERMDLLARTRSVLLDALGALRDHIDDVIVIGAQAVYLQTGGVDVALAEATKDRDVAGDPRNLRDEPRIEEAMRSAGFVPAESGQPGAWMTIDGIPVDLMVPELFSGKGRRGARIPPHSKHAARRARGLEAAIVDAPSMMITALNSSDQRVIPARVAGPAALIVAKTHKINERLGDSSRLIDKDAHDIYRIFRATETLDLGRTFRKLLMDDVSAEVTRESLTHLSELFAPGPTATGSMMAGRAESGVGNPDEVSTSVWILVNDLIEELSFTG